MPDSLPPASCPGTPVVETLPRNTPLVRVHPDDRKPFEFNTAARPPPLGGDPIRGGRFDSNDGAYAYLYAGLSERGAFAESFARDLDYTEVGPRPLPRFRWDNKAVSRVVTARPVRVVVVQGAGAQQLGQDDWLTRCDERGYPRCRAWAAAVRTWTTDTDGLIWYSKRDPEPVVVLWGDPHMAATGCGVVISGGDPEPLGRPPARARQEAFLTEWRLYLET